MDIIGLANIFLGLAGFILFGYLSSLFLFNNINLAERIYVAFILSVFLLPFCWLATIKIFGLEFSSQNYILVLLAFLVGLLTLLLAKRIKFLPFGGGKTINKKKLTIIVFVSLIFVGFGLFAISRTVVIDSGDTNYFMARTEALYGSKNIPTERPLFLVFAGGLAALTRSSLYFAFRWLIAGIGVMIFFPYFLRLRMIIANPVKLFFALLLIFATPTLLIELTVVRPQSLFILGLPAFIYFLSRGGESNDVRYYYLAGLITFSGLLIHELFLITTIVFIGFLLYKARFKIMTKPWRSLGWFFLFVFAIYPYIRDFGFVTFVTVYLQSYLIPGLGHMHFRFWFLDKIVSVANEDVSWIGWRNVLKYYAYYVGPAVAGIMIVMLSLFFRGSVSRFNKKIDSTARLALIFMFIFFANAEIAPRFGIGYLPERSWLFFDISALFLIPAIFGYFDNLRRKNAVLFVVLLISAVGFGGACYVAQAKGGLISGGEFNAAKDLRILLDDNSIVITQAGNETLLQEYAAKKTVVPPSVFFAKDEMSEKVKFIKGLSHFCGDKNSLFLQAKKTQIGLDLYFADPDANFDVEIKNLSDYRGYFEKLRNCEISDETAIYVVYSTDKEKNYLANRPYFHDGNFLGADLGGFHAPQFIEIYKNDSVIVWQVDRKNIESIK